MEINITMFYNNTCPKDYSASAAEIGQNAAADTWQAALDDSEDYMMLDDDDKRQAFREFLREFGAWDDVDMGDVALNALLIQFISGDIRAAGLDKGVTWAQYEASENAARLYKCHGGEVYYHIGV